MQVRSGAVVRCSLNTSPFCLRETAAVAFVLSSGDARLGYLDGNRAQFCPGNRPVPRDRVPIMRSLVTYSVFQQPTPLGSLLEPRR